jgi:hypothetical protein
MKLPSLSPSVALSRWAGTGQPAAVFGSVFQAAGGGGASQPKPGCWFVGTSCTGAYQRCKYCCNNRPYYYETCGWCVGFWDAPACA